MYVFFFQIRTVQRLLLITTITSTTKTRNHICWVEFPFQVLFSPSSVSVFKRWMFPDSNFEIRFCLSAAFKRCRGWFESCWGFWLVSSDLESPGLLEAWCASDEDGSPTLCWRLPPVNIDMIKAKNETNIAINLAKILLSWDTACEEDPNVLRPDPFCGKTTKTVEGTNCKSSRLWLSSAFVNTLRG